MKYGNYTGNKYSGWNSKDCQEFSIINQSIKGFMHEEQNKEDRLWNYIDGLSSAAEKLTVENLIASDPEWQMKYEELLMANRLINSSELDAPSLRFSKSVMEKIAGYQVARATKTYINKKIIWGIGGFFVVIIAAILVYAMGEIHWTNNGSSDILSRYNIDKLDWSKFFSNTYVSIFMMINVVLGLVLLDMYLRRRKEQNSQKEG
jgi:hypothetical protein